MEAKKGIKKILVDVKNNILNYGEEDIIQKFRDFYGEKYRHYYHEIAEFVYENSDEDEVEYLVTQLDYIVQDEEKYKSLIRIEKIKKLYDHLRLEILRLNKIKDENLIISKDIAKALSESTKLKDEFDSITFTTKEFTTKTKKDYKTIAKRSKKIEEATNNMSAQFVAILGIFTAIVFTLFGGVQSINIIVTVLTAETVSYLEALGLIIISTLIVFNVLFILIYFISKLTGKSIATEYGCYDKEKNTPIKLIKKYPPIGYTNAILIVAGLVVAVILIA